MILDLHEEKVSSSKESTIPPSQGSSSSSNVKKHVLFTRTEITVYPDGRVFNGPTKSWVQGFKPPVRKKVPKKEPKKKENKYKVEVVRKEIEEI